MFRFLYQAGKILRMVFVNVQEHLVSKVTNNFVGMLQLLYCEINGLSQKNVFFIGSKVVAKGL